MQIQSPNYSSATAAAIGRSPINKSKLIESDAGKRIPARITNNASPTNNLSSSGKTGAVSGSIVSRTGEGNSGSPSSSSGSTAIDKLKALIRELEAQLAALSKGNDSSAANNGAINASCSGNGASARANGNVNNSAVGNMIGASRAVNVTGENPSGPDSKLASSSAIEAAIQTAEGELVQLMLASGQSSGGIVSTRA